MCSLDALTRYCKLKSFFTFNFTLIFAVILQPTGMERQVTGSEFTMFFTWSWPRPIMVKNCTIIYYLQGYTMSTITWPFDSPCHFPLVVIWKFGPEPLSVTVFETVGPRYNDLDLLASRDVFGYVTMWFAICYLLLMVLWTRAYISVCFRDIASKSCWTRPCPFLITRRHRACDQYQVPFPTGAAIPPSPYFQAFWR